MSSSRPAGPTSAYGAAGVDYHALDAGKRRALTRRSQPPRLLSARGGRALDDSRGEPAFVFELAGQTLAFVVEGLGTKSIIARQLEEELGVEAFANVAYDTVAAIVNDLCCVGALPLVVNAYFATGSSDWYALGERARRAAGGVATRPARTPARPGEAASPRRCPAGCEPTRSSSPAARSARSPGGRPPDPRRGSSPRATRSSSSRAAACTRTERRWQEWSPPNCPTATAPAPRAGERSARPCSTHRSSTCLSSRR